MDLSTLMPQQREIATTLDRPLFVSAGAGSGKTFTLTRRILWALSPESGPFIEHLDQVLAITFTKDAAAEIRERVRAALIDAGMDREALAVDDAWISTIHGMCARILRAHALELGLDPEFGILEDTGELIEQAVDRAIAHAEETGAIEGCGRRLLATRDGLGVLTPEGVRYTRDGSFTLDANGMLVTKEGFAVLSRAGLDSEGGISIGQGLHIEVDPSGNIYTRSLNNDAIGEIVPIGSLAVVGFENPRYLKKVGKNLYEFPQERLSERQNFQDRAVVAQGFIEKSNVNAVLEMSALIETNRLVDMYQKVMKSHMDELNSEAISKLAVRA